MYTIKAFTQDGGEYWIHNPANEILITGDPYYEVGDNINGSAEFDIYPDHPYYQYVKKLTTDITFYKDGVEKFNGRVLYDDEDFNGTKHVYVEGELGYLCDSIQRPAVYHNMTVSDMLKTVINIHNSQVEERKQFVVGRVTVTDSNDSLYRYSNYENTREWIQDRLVDRLGGHLVIRKEKDTRYLDYLSDDDYYRRASQKIQFGENLLDYAKNLDATDLVTCLIPLGAQQDEQKIEGLEDYLTIADINGGVDYVTDDKAVAEYGRIFKTQTWDDVTVASNLKAKAEEYLKTVQYENLVLELKAIDLNLTDAGQEEFEVGDQVRCVSEPNNFDEWYPITKMRVYLMHFADNTFTLGKETKNYSYTSSNQQKTAEMTKKISEVPTMSEILKQALAEATDLINSRVASGYAIHEPNEFIVADDPDYLNMAKNLWRWGMGGLAHYSNGYYGPADGIAITMDGAINGEMLLANSVYAQSIDFGYTLALETLIDDAEHNANEYTDAQAFYVEERVTNSITNLENVIDLSVVSTKEAITQKNYVTAGESETINLDDWSFSGSSYGTWEIAEYQNVNCIKLTFTKSGTISFQQALGTLPSGNYVVQFEVAYDPDETYPNWVQYGFSGNTSQENLSGYKPTYFNTFKQAYEITESSRSIYGAINGGAGSVVYIKNLRVLRDYQDLLDDINTTFTVEVGKVQTTVEEYYESSLYDFCLNGHFTSTEGAFTDWYRSSTSYVTEDAVDGLVCCAISSSSHYIRQYVTTGKTGRVRIRCKGACKSGNESKAYLRVYVNGVYQSTTAGQLTTTWQTFTFDFEDVEEGQVQVRFYSGASSTTVYYTDIEILGSAVSYAGAQFTVLSDSISAEVARATTAEGALTTSINQTADSITAEVTRATAAETKYGTCDTAAGTAAKKVTCSSFTSDSLKAGATICVKFTYKNTASSPTLNVNSTGAKTIYSNGAKMTSDDYWTAGAYVMFVYDGTYWCVADSAASSKIQQLADSITLSVSSSSGTASIQISANGSKQGTSATVVTSARTAFANESSSITISAGTITFSGSLVALSGNYKTDMQNGYMRVYYNSTLYGMVTPVYSSSNPIWFSFMGSSSNSKGVSLGLGSTSSATAYVYIYNGYNLNSFTEKIQLLGTTRINNSLTIGTQTCDCKIWVNDNEDLYIYNGLYVYSNFRVRGTKSRVVETDNYGEELFYSYETASPTFGDSGSGIIGEDGQVSIFMEEQFCEAIDINDYQVFLTRTSEKQTEWVEKMGDYFVVYGEPGATFDWMVSAHQKDYAVTRLESAYDEPADSEGNIDFDDSIFSEDTAGVDILEEMEEEREKEVDLL